MQALRELVPVRGQLVLPRLERRWHPLPEPLQQGLDYRLAQQVRRPCRRAWPLLRVVPLLQPLGWL